MSGDLGRWEGPALMVLASLADEPRHGYAIIQDVGVTFGVALGPGTLYGAIARLEELGMIEALAPERRRRPYRITAAGAEALQREARRMRAQADVSLSRLAAAGSAA